MRRMMLLVDGDRWEGGLLWIELLKWLLWREAVHVLWQEWTDPGAASGGRAFSGRRPPTTGGGTPSPPMSSPMKAVGRGGVGVWFHVDLTCVPEG
jgi:hypothetical protein